MPPGVVGWNVTGSQGYLSTSSAARGESPTALLVRTDTRGLPAETFADLAGCGQEPHVLGTAERD